MGQEDERVDSPSASLTRSPVDQRAGDVAVPQDDAYTSYVSSADDASAGTQVVRERGVTPAQLRVDFGAHLEANYQRLVAQLYAITLDPGEAHDVVQDAYSRAWRSWVEVGRSPDPSAWIRRVAVRATMRSWRRVLARFGICRPKGVGEGADARTRALLAALGRLSPAERRAVVLFHMAGSSLEEIAALERVSVTLVQSRLAKARHVVTEGMADVLPDVLGLAGDDGFDVDGRARFEADYASGYDYDDGGERR
jgi:RNA polymerase sigma-70 factor (ECF subfamily)